MHRDAVAQRFPAPGCLPPPRPRPGIERLDALGVALTLSARRRRIARASPADSPRPPSFVGQFLLGQISFCVCLNLFGGRCLEVREFALAVGDNLRSGGVRAVVCVVAQISFSLLISGASSPTDSYFVAGRGRHFASDATIGSLTLSSRPFRPDDRHFVVRLGAQRLGLFNDASVSRRCEIRAVLRLLHRSLISSSRSERASPPPCAAATWSIMLCSPASSSASC